MNFITSDFTTAGRTSLRSSQSQSTLFKIERIAQEKCGTGFNVRLQKNTTATTSIENAAALASTYKLHSTNVYRQMPQQQRLQSFATTPTTTDKRHNTIVYRQTPQHQRLQTNATTPTVNRRITKSTVNRRITNVYRQTPHQQILYGQTPQHQSKYIYAGRKFRPKYQ